MRVVEFFALTGLVIGWLATHLFSEARERRKESRAQLDKLIERIGKYEADAADFHSAAAFNLAKNGTLISDFDRIQRLMRRMPLVPDIDQLSGELIALRRSVTLRNFDASKFVQQTSGSDILIDIVQSGRNLEDQLEGLYLSRYPSAFPYFDWRKSTTTVKLVVGLLSIFVIASACMLVDWRPDALSKNSSAKP